MIKGPHRPNPAQGSPPIPGADSVTPQPPGSGVGNQKASSSRQPRITPHASDSLEAPSVQRLADICRPQVMSNKDERFHLEDLTVVAHPDRPLIAYHMVWSDDFHVYGGDNTDHEVIWVEHDGKRPTKVYTYFHGNILEKELSPGEKPEVRMQFGFHGCVPKGDNSFTRKAWDMLQFVLSKLRLRDWVYGDSRPEFKRFESSYKDFVSATKPVDLKFNPSDIHVSKGGNAEVQAAMDQKFGEGRQVHAKVEWPEPQQTSRTK